MIGVVGVLFVAGIVLFNFVLMPVLVHNRAAVIVPDLRQISEAQASETLEKLALTLRVTHSENSAEVPEGYVISQSPRPNESIKEGRSVEVVLSLGAKTQRVPDLAGMSLRQVRGCSIGCSCAPGACRAFSSAVLRAKKSLPARRRPVWK